METALDVLSHAATIVQDNANESRSKELPTAKWRRDRRLRAGEYHTGITAASGSIIGSTVTATATSPGGLQQQNVPHAGQSALLTQHPHHLSSPQHHHSHLHHLQQQQQQDQQQQHNHHIHALASPPAHVSMMLAAAAMRPLCESTNRPLNIPSPTTHSLDYSQQQHQLAMETPLDMSVTSTTMKQRASPPPPYREPLPGSTYATALARPSVITQAPPKRHSRDSMLLANRENDNCSTDSTSMCETVIDEHFRRSLGPDYVALFGKKSPAPNTTPSPQPQSYVFSATPTQAHTSTSTPTPTPQPAHVTATVVAAFAAATPPPPAYHLSPQALISPKSSNILLQTQNLKSTSNSPQPQFVASLPPPQEQPLALQRTPPFAAAVAPPTKSPRPTTPKTPAASSPTPATFVVTPASSPTPLPPSTNGNATVVVDLHSPNTTITTPATTFINHNNAEQHKHQQKSHTIAAMPAIIQIKREPGLACSTNSNSTNTNTITNSSNSNSAANTPPHSPLNSNSNSNATATMSVKVDDVPSVDDHFAKALGDTWKKLQQEHRK